MTDQPTDTKPWGDDFDEAKAWTLIQNLRADKTRLTDSLTTERQAREVADTAAKSSDTDGKIAAAAEKRATTAERSLYVERALRKHAIDEDLVDFLTGDTEEEILARAERLAKVSSPKPEGGKPAGDKPDGEAGDKPDADKPEEGLPGRPQPGLTPGHGGTPPEPFDADAVVTSIRKSPR